MSELSEPADFPVRSSLFKFDNFFYWRLDIAYVLSKRDCRLNTHQELFHSNTVASSKHEVDTGFIQLLFPLVIMRVTIISS